MRRPALILPALLLGLGLSAAPAPAQLIHTIEDRNTPRPPKAKPSEGPSVGPIAKPTPRPLPPPPPAFDGITHHGLAPTPNVARWHARSTARTLSRADLVWYAGRGWRCRRDDGTTGTVQPAGLIYRYGNMTGKQSLGKVIAAAPSGTLGRQVDSGIILCH